MRPILVPTRLWGTMMKTFARLRSLPTLACVLMAGLAVACAAGSRTVAEPVQADAAMTISPEAEGVTQIVTAAHVAAWGRTHSDPGALIMAARILAEVPVRPGADSGEAVLTPDRLLDEAATYANGSQGVLDAIARLRTGTRGVRSSPFGQGPIFQVREIKARETYGFEVEARGGEVLRVAAIGDGDTNIDMSVRDEAGALVCEDGFGDHYPVCTVQRRQGGKVRIDIVNRGAVWTKVQILSN
ncbi:hypothetical protein [Brevundimonas sp.]|jgi:hypothetical protein|uniref:hypothetical protein n=1 Tax=Brevundimonas sp. TaxID=1871086 RepID=UPI0037837A51